MLKIDGTTILLPAGDTAIQKITITGADFTDNDKVVFSILSRDGNRTYLTKILDIADGEAVQGLTNADTENIRPGDYKWSLRVVINAVIEDGEIVSGTEVHTPFVLEGCKGGLSTMRIQEAGINV